MAIASSKPEQDVTPPPPEPASEGELYPKVTCEYCGRVGEPLHLGCSLCEECCDCRP